jgi:hypothetical protein
MRARRENRHGHGHADQHTHHSQRRGPARPGPSELPVTGCFKLQFTSKKYSTREAEQKFILCGVIIWNLNL